MNYKIKVKGSFDPGTLVTDGNQIMGVVSDRDQYESEVSLADLVRGVMKYRGLTVTAAKATKQQWEEFIKNKPQYLRTLSLEEKIFHTVFVADEYGSQSAELLVEKILNTLVSENASHDAIQEYVQNINFIFENAF